MPTTRRLFLSLMGSTALAGMVPAFAAPARRKPNFIVILCDDLGYGDIEPTGGKAISTPNLNRMARQGMVLTDYYAPANVCTPSRVGLLTGRYPIRSGLAWGVILQGDKRVLSTSEVTIPKALKVAGYASGLFGKWHLGHSGPDWRPTRHGFDRFFGIPYSHDMMPLTLITDSGPGSEPSFEAPVQSELQQRFYDEAIRFIDAMLSLSGVQLAELGPEWKRLRQLCLDNLAAMWVGDEAPRTVPRWRSGQVEFNSAGEFR